MITAHNFGHTRAGAPATRFRLENGRGAHADILDYGGTLQSLCLPCRAGNPIDVVLGYDDLAGYEGGGAYLGATLGRYANRLCGARYVLDGRAVAVSANEGKNCLHGGFQGFDKRM
ncbi:MAG: galactose-1-epimerase, partial [Clostridia bacterium]|nr:galactose-1-epimerase [Clostridia bacterium]